MKTSSNLNTDFKPALILLNYISHSWLFFLIPISIVPIALYLLELIELSKVVALSASQITEFADQVKRRFISQLISGISRVFQKLLEYFNGTAISTFAILTSLVLLVNLDLNLNDSQCVMLLLGSSLRYCHRQLHGVFS